MTDDSTRATKDGTLLGLRCTCQGQHNCDAAIAHNCESSRACYAVYSKCGCGVFVAFYFDAYHRYVQKTMVYTFILQEGNTLLP